MRPHPLTERNRGRDDIHDYARTCGINTDGALTTQDVTNLLPTLKAFGRVD